jgi:biopolymer transport protein ExbB/TolQ
MSVTTIVAVVSISFTLVCAIAAYAVTWGIMTQKIKDLTEQVSELKRAKDDHAEKIGAQDACNAALTQKIEGIEKKVDSIDVKLDRLLDRQASGRPV